MLSHMRVEVYILTPAKTAKLKWNVKGGWHHPGSPAELQTDPNGKVCGWIWGALA